MNLMSTEHEKQPRSPRVIHISWGRMEVEGLGYGS